MDIDNTDIDSISCQFRTASLNDKDYLIAEFKRLSNTELSDEGCLFYLDLAEWNLNQALWAYYEYEVVSLPSPSPSYSLSTSASSSSTNSTLSTSQQQLNTSSFYMLDSATGNLSPVSSSSYSMKLIADLSYFPAADSFKPNVKFTKTWRIQNNGSDRWPVDCYLKLIDGYNFDLANSASGAATGETMESACRLARVNQREPGEYIDITIHIRTPTQLGAYKCDMRLHTPHGQVFVGDAITMVVCVGDDVAEITDHLNSVNMFGSNATRSPTTAAITDVNNNNNNAEVYYTSACYEDEKRPDFYDDMFS